MPEETPYDPDVVDAKAVRPGYAPPAFYFKQTSREGGTRWVAWARNSKRARDVINPLLRLMPSDLDVLLKLDKGDTPDGPVFT